MAKKQKEKMVVEIQKPIVSPDFAYHATQVVELDSVLAKKWIKSGIAKPVKREKQIETTENQPDENEMIEKSKKRKNYL